MADNATAKAQAVEEKSEKETKIIDPRIDPYGNRDYGYKPPSPEAGIYSWVSYRRILKKSSDRIQLNFWLGNVVLRYFCPSLQAT